MKLSLYKSILLSTVVKNLYLPVALIVTFVLSSSYGRIVFAENENHLRLSNNRLWSIISDKIPFEAKYSPENIRKSTPKQELLKTPPPKEKYKTTHAKKILQLLEAPPDQDKFKKESLKKYTTGSKGRAEDFNEDKIAIKQFCEVQATTAFCIRRGVGRYKYVGNTPRKPPRDLDFSGKNLANRKKGSKKLIKSLMKNQNRSN
ncbi:MAG: hypothetical protein QF779_04435 [SAR324 cluster bacterium]|nr:hypothetical protein [SAR324 cluster bacterium]